MEAEDAEGSSSESGDIGEKKKISRVKASKQANRKLENAWTACLEVKLCIRAMGLALPRWRWQWLWWRQWLPQLGGLSLVEENFHLGKSTLE